MLPSTGLTITAQKYEFDSNFPGSEYAGFTSVGPAGAVPLSLSFGPSEVVLTGTWRWGMNCPDGIFMRPPLYPTGDEKRDWGSQPVVSLVSYDTTAGGPPPSHPPGIPPGTPPENPPPHK
jgi:hypothetical protein